MKAEAKEMNGIFWLQVQFLLLIQWCKAYTDTALTGEGGVRQSTSYTYVRGKIESLSQFGFKIEQTLEKYLELPSSQKRAFFIAFPTFLHETSGPCNLRCVLDCDDGKYFLVLY